MKSITQALTDLQENFTPPIYFHAHALWDQDRRILTVTTGRPARYLRATADLLNAVHAARPKGP